MWELMQVFGHRMGNGFRLVFETSIQVAIDPPPAHAPQDGPDRDQDAR
jgi:hypothetical protein